MTHHAWDEMIADDLYIEDVEHIIMSGSIIRIEVDRKDQERKYIICGKSIDGYEAEVVTKNHGCGRDLHDV